MSIIITLIIFSVIVIIHEYGHFIVAQKCGVLVEEFAVGMGPKIFSKQKGDVVYSIRLFPIGGFCRMADVTEESSKKIGLNQANVFKRIAIVIAGPMMNFILALVILTILTLCSGFAENNIKEVIEGYPAQSADIREGDIIYKINGKRIRTYNDLSFEMSNSKGNTIEIVIKRKNQFIKKYITPVVSDGQYVTGIKLNTKTPFFRKEIDGFEKAGFFESVNNSFWDMLFLIKVMVTGIIELFTAKTSMDEVAGPIGLTTVIGETYYESIKYSISTVILNMANITALLSANLGIMNLLPLPALDGGRLVFFIIELIRRKPVPIEKESFVHFIGFAVLLGLGVFIAFHDIIKLL